MSEDRAKYSVSKEEIPSQCTITVTFSDKDVHFETSGSIEFKFIAFAFCRYMAWFLRCGIVCDGYLLNLARRNLLVEFDSAISDPNLMEAMGEKKEVSSWLALTEK